MPTTVRRPSGRVTPRKPAAPKAPKGTKLVTLEDGTKFFVKTKVNQFRLMRVQASIEDENLDVAAYYKLLTGLVHEDDQQRFVNYLDALGDTEEGEDGGFITEIIRKLMEAASEGNPTDTRSDSGPTVKPTTSRKRSAAS